MQEKSNTTGEMMIDSNIIQKLLPQAFSLSQLPLSGRCSGKVRDWYPLHGKRLMVTTDRLSAFDRNLATVPFKGQVLNQLSAWWFEQTQDIIKNHLLSLPDPNAALVVEVKSIPIEVIVRGYITGVTSTALWHRYALGERDIYGYTFPDGLQKNQALPQPIITPTTKGEAGEHDERLTCQEVVESGILDSKTWKQIMDAALAMFYRGQELAARAGIILVDTKYEFGTSADGNVLVIDEVHTPDSSRFWQAESYPERFQNGQEPENFDKEFVRLAYTERGFRGDGEPPILPDDVWVATSQRYIQIYELLSGKGFEAGEYPVEPRMIKNLQKTGLL